MVDQELKDWQATWQSAAESTRHAPPFDIRRHAARAGRRLTVRYASGCLWALALLVFSAVYAQRHPTLQWLLWAAAVWIATLVAVGFMIWNGRGLWTAADRSNAAYVELSRKRCLAELRMIRFGYALLSAELVVVIPWLVVEFLFQMAVAGIRAGLAPDWVRRAAGVDGGLSGLVRHCTAAGNCANWRCWRTSSAALLKTTSRSHWRGCYLAVTPSYGFAVLQYPNAQRAAVYRGPRQHS